MRARHFASVQAVLVLTAAVLVLLPEVRCSRRRSIIGPTAEILRSLWPSRPQAFLPRTPGLGIHSWLTPCFYGRRDFCPAWINDQGLSPQVRPLLGALAEASAEGLDPCDYDRDRAEALVFHFEGAGRHFRGLDPRFLAELDVVLTDAFLLYASHLCCGKVNPETGLAEHHSERADEGLVDLLENSLAAGDVRSMILGLRPQHEYYRGLRDALRDSHERLSRLGPEISTDDPRCSAGGRGAGSRRKALLEQEIETLRLNLERWRWLPRDLGDRFVLIDTAGFRLLLGDRGRIPMSMKVVVGNTDWQTPVLSAEITGFIINPHWDCPSRIFYKETINYIKSDKNYLPSNKMVILEGWGSRERELDPSAVDWTTINPSTRPQLHLRQLPGPLNILGRLKFIMLNPEDVFLHDTPYQDDFKKAERIFSHGCIRAEKPFDLAAFLSGSPLWTKDRILAAIDALEEKKVSLDAPIPIYVNYFTAWPLPEGRVEFRRDVYGCDEKLARAMESYTESALAGTPRPRSSRSGPHPD